MMPVSAWVRARLHRRLFFWFGAVIVVTAAVVSLGVGLLRPSDGGWRDDVERAGGFLAGRFALVWHDENARAELASSLARELHLGVRLSDRGGRVLLERGPPCRYFLTSTPVVTSGSRVGALSLCGSHHHPGRKASVVVGLLLALATLWAAAGVLARRLTRPLREVARVAADLGAGRTGSRVRLSRSRHGEAALVGEAINDMAARVERQLAEQKELMAEVSHEMRTPLGHMRVLKELLEDATSEDARKRALQDLERELSEADALVGELLARSRLDVGALEQKELSAASLAMTALERAGVPLDRLRVNDDVGLVRADATLLLRALANLLDNAARHGGGATALVVTRAGGEVLFLVQDGGPGLPAGDEERAFDKYFSRGASGRSLGLGLALVKRIAEAHGGRALVAPAAGEGAGVGIALPSLLPAAR